MKQTRRAEMELKLDKRVIDEAVQKAVEDIKQNFIAKSEVIEWLNSFDTNSATKCFEAVNNLKMKIAQEEMHEADERLLNSNWGDMEVRG